MRSDKEFAWRMFDEYGDRYFSKPQINRSLDSWINHAPHYSDSNFSSGQTKDVFGEKEPGLDYVYSDRMWEWDYDKAKKASAIACEKGLKPFIVRWHQEFLNAYFEKPVELRHMIVGVNVSNGYPYQCYGFKRTEA